MKGLIRSLGYLALFIALVISGSGMMVGLLWSIGALTFETGIFGVILIFILMSALVRSIRDGD